ncbi:MAG: HlyD family efflux transporter periplasmic adaptor subunit, partial [Pseudomonadota bacterium]|nr:HlyD family efflux transporter periplasmic adaptor subunit [Pseudomonadota bacterium]
LEVKAVEAERALAEASAAMAKARVDAVLPRSQISGLDFDRYQGERERAERDLDVKKKTSDTAADAVRRQRGDAVLQAGQRQLLIDFNIARQEQAQVRAVRDGVVVHGYSDWSGERYDEGASAYPGNAVGNVMGTGGMRVQAWAAEADRPFLAVGQTVRLSFDALSGKSLEATIKAIAGAPTPRAAWGSARYFRVDIALPPTTLPLVAGMSVLVERAAPRADAATATIVAAAPAPLQIEGEIASRSALPIAPPAIPNVWQYTLAQLAPEGTLVKQGDLIATFDANTVTTQIETRRAALKEKQSTLVKIRLDQAEAARAADLAVAEAASNFERAKRKAMQPKELIRRIDYDKLVIERALAEQLAALALTQRDAQARARKAEMSALTSEVARHEGAIAVLVNGKMAMSIKAPHAGMVVYRNQFSGEKFAVGTQVWKGLSVATLADPDKLIVQAKVPEMQAAGVQVGQTARVTLQGANAALNAKVVAVGRTYHGKSKSQPVIVRDLELEFDQPPKGLKPGAAVQVSLQPIKGKAA